LIGFELLNKTQESITFLLNSNLKTFEKYPFEFQTSMKLYWGFASDLMAITNSSGIPLRDRSLICDSADCTF
jgi:hypothetical protein